MPNATTDHVDLWYERDGEGAPVLFVSGTGSDLRQKPGPLDGPLAKRFDLLAYDHRGQGRSSSPDGDWSMVDYAGDAVGLLDAVGWARAHVVGVSFGGMVAQELAIRHPERVDRLVLCCTSSGGAGASSYPLQDLQDLPEDERLRTALAIADTRFGRDWQDEHPEDAAALLELAASRTGTINPRQLAARRTHDTYDRLGEIAAPTLVAAGRYDGIAPLANSEALAAGIPDAELRVYDGGHLFLMQDHTAFDDILAFLR